ncbi:Golgi-specific brefeldin A-resistance guanine nucleotide exchange factor 1 [Nymphon striatum]|nr:Golgi-specific brefeldin A-resistance guanine nucleotide exchange factor 1 [Nymphon striatum]
MEKKVGRRSKENSQDTNFNSVETHQANSTSTQIVSYTNIGTPEYAEDWDWDPPIPEYDASGEYMIIYNFQEPELDLYNLLSEKRNIGLILHCTLNHIFKLLRHIELWPGPISLTIFLVNNDLKFTTFVINFLNYCYSEIQARVAIHVVFPTKKVSIFQKYNIDISDLSCEEALGVIKSEIERVYGTVNYNYNIPYPSNLMRNVGWNGMKYTEFVMNLDMDIFVDKNLYTNFISFIDQKATTIDLDRTIFVPPVFEIKPTTAFPSTKHELLKEIRLSNAQPFYNDVCGKCQNNTNYHLWQSHPPDSPFGVSYEVQYANSWEPYYICKQNQIQFDERFLRYGMDRLSQFMLGLLAISSTIAATNVALIPVRKHPLNCAIDRGTKANSCYKISVSTMSKTMSCPENGVYIVMGELSFVVTAMKKGNRWSSHVYQDEHQDILIRNFSNLKEILNHVSDLSELEPYTFLSPFLDVIRSEDTTGPVTGLALSSVNKFLAYNLISVTCETAPVAVENIAIAVTHARFVGTDHGSDEVVLIKILHVLRTLLLTPIGALLTNDSVCEIMQSCFRICFEMRLSELLRKSAEHSLMDMVQLLFSRLPQFSEDISKPGYFSSMNKKFKMRTGSGLDTSTRNHRRRKNTKESYKKMSNKMNLGIANASEYSNTNENISNAPVLLTPPESCAGSPIDTDSASQTCKVISTNENTAKESESIDNSDNFNSSKLSIENDMTASVTDLSQNDVTSEMTEASSDVGSVEVIDDLQSFPSMTDISIISGTSIKEAEYVNAQGVRFTASQQGKNGNTSLMPYGLPCVRELFRYLISLTNPFEKHNTDVMVQIGLTLLTVALESGADHISSFKSLLNLVQDDMCRNLFSLLNSERLSVFAAALRASFLLFESMRTNLKLQLEMYLTRLMSIIISESPKVSYEQREIALDSVVKLWRIPGLVTELYLNYDCDLYCSNLFEDLTKLLSKNTFPVSGLYSTHLLSLDALLTVVDCIESHCHSRVLHDNQITNTALPQESTASTSEGSDKSVSSIATDIVFGNQNVTALQASGYQMATYFKNLSSDISKTSTSKMAQKKLETGIRHSRMKISENIPSHETLMAIKHRKKLLATGTEHFNSKPSKGITFLQENGLLTIPLDPSEVTIFLKENPKLDKKMIGEYISSKKNQNVLDVFVRSFSFESTRVDEALRMYLEVFRLPGEAPVISLLLEQFAEHWHKSNHEPFVNSDAAFTFAYAIIMLNVDQHNHNVKKQSTPMTLEEFKKNLSKVNGNQDFNEEMLEDTYYSIKNEEIIMPAEQTGLVRENYLWKLLLKRGTTKDGIFVHAPNGLYDHDLFSLIWGPTVAALSFVFDKSSHDASITQRAISGFRKCAMISAHYGMSDVFDNLIISLLKFTTLLSSSESPENLAITFGNNFKAQLAAKTVFNLAHRHGDILREGWKNILDCVLQLFKAKLLPKPMVEAEDFVHPRGVISLISEEIPAQRAESGLLSSFYSYITLTSDTQAHKGLSPEDGMAIEASEKCISDCHPDQLITESKFLRIDSLQELVKAIIFASHGPDAHASSCGGYDEESTVFFLELLVKIVIQNRDRVRGFWSSVRDHIYSLVMSASASDHYFLMERAVVGILRLAIRLLRKEEMAPQVLQSLRMLLILKPHTLLRVSRQVSFALHELLRTNAANIHNSQDWSTLFTLLECVGAGCKPPKVVNSNSNSENEGNFQFSSVEQHKVQSDSEVSSMSDLSDKDKALNRGYTSDGELYNMNAHYQYEFSSKKSNSINTTKKLNPNAAGGWILVGKEGEIETVRMKAALANQYKMTMNCDLMPHDTRAFMKSCESLAFLVRDVAHITPENFELCVRCIQTFVEASMNGG